MAKHKSNQIMDLTGQRFGRLVVVSLHGRVNSRTYWDCLCDCGKPHRAATGNLRAGSVRSCGCYARENMSRVKRTHGMSNTRIFNCWDSMKQRCLNPNHRAYERYGGRGIAICERWLESFSAFREDMGEMPEGASIDRMDNDGNYEPGNCHWATPVEQQRNRRCTKTLTFHDRTMTLKDWSIEVGVNYRTLWDRLDNGWSPHEALFGRPSRRWPNKVSAIPS